MDQKEKEKKKTGRHKAREGKKKSKRGRTIKRRPSDWVDGPCVTSVKC